MKDKILFGTIIALVIAMGILFFDKDKTFSAVDTDGNTYRSDITASSTILTITTDAQVFATSTNSRALYRRIVNNCTATVFIADTSDSAASLETGFLLAANGGVWDNDNNHFLYMGAVRASSTDETSCALHVVEY